MQLRDKNGRFLGTGNTPRRRRNRVRPTSKTNVVFVVDMSASMQRYKSAVIENFNAQINLIPRGDKVQIVPFNSYVHSPVNRLDDYNYQPSGMTALWDATGHSINLANDGITPMLVIVLTDGEENVSNDRYATRLRNVIASCDDRLTLAFMVPPGRGDALARRLDIPRANITEWEQSDQGYAETMSATQQAVGTFYQARATGMTKSQAFYTDASKVTPQALSNSLQQYTNVRSLTVGSECEIRPFIEAQGVMYVPGEVAYQLTKPEVVQSYKDIFIREKGKNAVYGGKNVRNLLGLPYTDAKVIPGNHGNYDIFVVSRSHNRKLVRGTKVLLFNN